MYSSSNPSPSLIPGLPPPSGIVFDPEKDGLYFNHHTFVSKEYYYFDHASPPPPVKYSGLQNCDNRNSNPNLSAGADISPCNKKVVGSKKDRHSKIFTARGPRDRRVRLSIDISKKFFSLQDLLGFDTASKTLDWLFTKSKNAIRDLVEEMKHTSSSTLSDQCEEVFMDKGDYLDKKVKIKKLVNRDKTMKTRKKKSGLHVNLSARKQLREEARCRARERTIEKLRIKKLNKDVQNLLGDYNYCYLESSSGNQFQSQSNHEVQIGESLIELELPKQFSLLYDSQQEYLNSNDSSSQFKNSTL